MAFRRMNRMISFRVSDDEFERLRMKSQEEGSRSVSDYARLALAREARGENEWAEQMQALHQQMQRLTELLAAKES